MSSKGKRTEKRRNTCRNTCEYSIFEISISMPAKKEREEGVQFEDLGEHFPISLSMWSLRLASRQPGKDGQKFPIVKKGVHKFVS